MAGLKVMTATSGPGISLYSEAWARPRDPPPGERTVMSTFYAGATAADCR
jgi:hypothetical protein